MAEEVNDEVQAVLEADDAQPVDSKLMAAAINALGLQRKADKRSYERTIVSYLHEQATAPHATSEQRTQIQQQIRRLFANLSPEVRQQLFRASLDPSGQETPR
jgi:hypothetical protein